MDLENTLFMLPGPVKIHPRVLRVMSMPALPHRSPEFSKINEEIRDLLRYAFQVDDDYHVAVFSGSGTSGLEAVISGILNKEDSVLCIINGKFGERLYEICNIYANAHPLEIPWGQAPTLDAVEEIIEKYEVTAIALCHNETSTGMTNPAEEIGRIAKEHDLIYILDGITSVGGIELYPKEWGVDAIVLGSQKCLAAPAGLAAVAISDRAYQRIGEGRTYYLDLKKHIDKIEKGDTPYTPAIPLFLAFKEALLMLKEEGIEKRWERNKMLATMLRSAVKALGLQLFPEEKFASNTVTAIRYPKGIEDKEFRGILKEELGVIVAGGQSIVKGKIFRIGHMGICSEVDIMATISAIEYALLRLGYEFEAGAGVGEAIKVLSTWRMHNEQGMQKV
ncbi:MAG: aminotransferase [Thermoplasmata archaeon]|nr:MAG: aminotransferase [Thermoplasmata archaeon]